MRIAVIGAGVVGVTTAYYLANAGHTVTVLDSADGVATGTSCANGAQLSYSFTDALARPEMLRKLPGALAGLDPAIRVRQMPSREFIRWGMQFVTQCTVPKARENTLSVLRQSMRSAELFAELRQQVPGDFSYRAAGKLVLLSDENAVRAAEDVRQFKASYGCKTEVLSLREAIEIEPAIEKMRNDYAGAIYSKGDEVADAGAFTKCLSGILVDSFSVQFVLGTTVNSLITESGNLHSLQTSNGPLDVDAAVVCAGVASDDLLKPLGINTGICPVRGYSITVPRGEASPTTSVTDPARRIVFSSIDAGMRIAGFADFVGLNTKRDSSRISTLLWIAKAAAPHAANYDVDSINGWGGFRAMTSNSQPQIGATPVGGLFLNIGHNMLGWTLACSSGEQIANLVSYKSERQSKAA